MKCCADRSFSRRSDSRACKAIVCKRERFVEFHVAAIVTVQFLRSKPFREEEVMGMREVEQEGLGNDQEEDEIDIGQTLCGHR